MKHAHYRNLKELLHLKRDTYRVDVEKGQLLNIKTGKSIGSMQQGKGQIIAAIYFDGDTYKYYLKDIVAVAAGWDIRGKTVIQKDQNPYNNALSNLTIKET